MILAIALGGALGAVGRYQSSVWIGRWLGTGFPYGTLAVNVIGSFAMGLFVEAVALKFSVTQEVRAFVVTGLLGAFTTFSSFSLDVSVLYARGTLMPAAFYVAGSVALSVLGLFAGLWVMRSVLT